MLYTFSGYEFDHYVMTTDLKFLTFTVTACKDVHIFLTHLPGDVNKTAYKISLGLLENLVSTIDKLPPNAESQNFNTPGILSCSEQQMWASWSDGLIQIGMGLVVRENVLLEWNDPQPYAINAFSLASRDTSEVVWTFPKDLCEH